MPMNSRLSRRRFLRDGAATAAAAAAGLGSSTRFAAAKDSPEQAALKAANAKTRLAFVGVGPKGLDNLGDFTNGVGITPVAVCDVDERYLADALEIAPDARTYVDFREMLDREAPNVD